MEPPELCLPGPPPMSQPMQPSPPQALLGIRMVWRHWECQGWRNPSPKNVYATTLLKTSRLQCGYIYIYMYIYICYVFGRSTMGVLKILRKRDCFCQRRTFSWVWTIPPLMAKDWRIKRPIQGFLSFCWSNLTDALLAMASLTDSESAL